MRGNVRQGRYQKADPPEVLEKMISQLRDFANLQYVARRDIQTTDATATEIWSETIAPLSAWHLETRIVAYSAGADDMAGYHEVRRYHRGSAGAPTLSSNASVVVDFEDVAGWGYAFATDAAGKITLSVTGAAATTIDWAAFIVGFQSPRIRQP